MSDATLTFGLLLGPALAGLLVGLMLARLLAGAGQRAAGRLGRGRVEDVNHRLRAIEAEFRIAQRSLEQLKAERDGLAAELARSGEHITSLENQAATDDERLRKLRSDLQHECAKTAKLRQELAERAEEMVRTYVQLRDTQNELGVNQVGSDVILEQIARLEQEREDLNKLVETLRAEAAARRPDGRSERLAPGGPDALLDC